MFVNYSHDRFAAPSMDLVSQPRYSLDRRRVRPDAETYRTASRDLGVGEKESHPPKPTLSARTIRVVVVDYIDMVSHGYLLATRGVVLSNVTPQERTSKVQTAIVELASRAETLGYDSLWAGDSVLAKPRLDPLTVLAGAATATESVGLGTAVYLPTLRHPATVAHQTATVDLLSNGRFEFGVGVGTGSKVQKEYAQLDRSYERRGRALDETLDIVTALWEGTSIDYDGEVYQLSDVELGFRPSRSPPIHVASSDFDPTKGFPSRISRRIREHADGWLPLSMSPGRYEQGLERAKRHVEGAGGDPSRLEPMYYQDIVVADSEREALEEAHDFLEDYGAVPRHATGGTSYPFEERGAFGTPETIESHLEAYKDAGVETFVTRFPSYDQATQLRKYASLIDSA